ncbi:Predicted arabinose efflux permease, MFS family [Micromonospora phaseoli]|uniref:Predicted arabinose efflux permease, MFS family n=1 Tax=Micromonospora phaseoli TaxID=1144548 RepID=A0A1H7CN34_9ACTN|nr:MFS transporter [Micromonospora phaseoli]PZV91661.1 putative MFS family arabinose efflux permease [Micromonospora phaseoli]GIJ79292.1 MFS transporter [Micromonospora phaseoli]SEJ91173.1 Predicted arabinose efflux permease, MFS family [Micromonospora phaseoli]
MTAGLGRLRRRIEGLGPLVAAHGIGVVGTEITALALPTLAILTLGASPLVASALFAIEFGTHALASPVLGVLVDRARTPRRLLVGASLGYAAVVSTVPVAAVLDLLTIPLLAVVAVVAGGLGALVTIGLQAAVPTLVPPQRLVEANSAMAGARSVGQVAGPALAGWLVQVAGAATAIGVDAVTRLLGVLAYARLRAVAGTGPAATTAGPTGRMLDQLREGVAAMRQRPVLVRVAVTAAALNFGGSALGALYLVFAYQHLHLSPGLIGITYVVSSVVSMLAVAVASRVIRTIGMARVVPVFAPLAGAALFLIPAAVVAPPFVTLVVYEAIFSFCATIWFIATTTLQQSLVPTHQLGRVIALGRAATTLAIPVGALLGGALAQWWGLVPTLVLFASAALLGGCVSSLRGTGMAMPTPEHGTNSPIGGPDGGDQVGSIAPSSGAAVDAVPRRPES